MDAYSDRKTRGKVNKARDCPVAQNQSRSNKTMRGLEGVKCGGEKGYVDAISEAVRSGLASPPAPRVEHTPPSPRRVV